VELGIEDLQECLGVSGTSVGPSVLNCAAVCDVRALGPVWVRF